MELLMAVLARLGLIGVFVATFIGGYQHAERMQSAGAAAVPEDEDCEFTVYNESRWSITLLRLVEGKEGALEMAPATPPIFLKPAERIKSRVVRQWFQFIAVRKGEEDYVRVGGLQFANCRAFTHALVFTDRLLGESHQTRMRIEMQR